VENSIANTAIVQSQILIVFTFRPAVAPFPFSFVVQNMTNLLGVESGNMQEHRMCHGKIRRREQK
jgi:hypothetical protein